MMLSILKPIIVPVTVLTSVVFGSKLLVDNNKEVQNYVINFEKDNKYLSVSKFMYNLFDDDYKNIITEEYLSQLDEKDILEILKQRQKFYDEYMKAVSINRFIYRPTGAEQYINEKLPSQENVLLSKINYLPKKINPELFWKHGVKSLILSDTSLMNNAIVNCINKQLQYKDYEYAKGNKAIELIDNVNSISEAYKKDFQGDFTGEFAAKVLENEKYYSYSCKDHTQYLSTHNKFGNLIDNCEGCKKSKTLSKSLFEYNFNTIINVDNFGNIRLLPKS
jgi:hypothetical protein